MEKDAPGNAVLALVYPSALGVMLMATVLWQIAFLGSMGTHWAAGVQAAGAFLGGLGFIGVAGGFIVSAVQARRAEITRNAVATAEFLRRWHAEPLCKARQLANTHKTREDLQKAYRDARTSNSDDFFIYESELAFFEELGVLYKHEGIELSWIRDSLGSTVRWRWQVWEPTILGVRAEFNRTSFYSNFEDLKKTLETT